MADKISDHDHIMALRAVLEARQADARGRRIKFDVSTARGWSLARAGYAAGWTKEEILEALDLAEQEA